MIDGTMILPYDITERLNGSRYLENELGILQDKVFLNVGYKTWLQLGRAPRTMLK